MNEVLKAIYGRRSNRGYSEVQLTEEQLQAIIDAALASPTARNLQYWHFSVVQNQEFLNEMNSDLGAIMEAKLPEGQRGRFNESGFHVFYHAPTVIFISIPRECENRFAEVDAGIAVENIAIAAQGMGLGSVIVGMVKDVFLSDREEYYNKALGIPEGYRYAIAIALGNPTMSKEAHPIGEGKVTIIR